MNFAISKNAVIKRIRRALRHWNWSLVVARGDWFRNDQHLGSFYVVDANGNVTDHHCDLMTLARDLMVLSEWETVEGCDRPLVEPEPATKAVAHANGVPWEELKDGRGRAWVSWPRVNKAPHTW